MEKCSIRFFIATAAMFIFNNVYAQAPVITYSTPQVYTTGTAIATLSPTNTGGAVVTGGYSPATTFANVATPYGVALDPSGNVYSIDEADGYLYKNTSAINIFNIFLATGIAVDGVGNIYVSDLFANSVLKFNSSGTLLSTTSGFNAPYGIAIDASNNAYVVDNGSGSIIKIAAGTTTKSTYLSGFANPFGVTIDPSGNTFVSQVTSNSIIRVAFGTSTKTIFATGFNGPRNLTDDAAGNVYVADFGNNVLKQITPAGAVSTILSGLSSPRGAAFDASGNIYIADFGTNTIKKSIATGYTISAALPAGLSFNTSTGAITGTPTTISATTVYTITAYNTTGSNATTVSITVSAPTIYGNYAFNDLITLNTASLGITSNLTNFPALLSIQDNDLIISNTCTDKVTNPNGPNYDFAFVSAGSELYYQVESYNQSTGTLLVWVQIPTLTYATNNTITFYFGSPSPTVTHNTAFFANTWASNYLAVFHFNEASYTGSIADGTVGGHTGAASGMTSADLVAGKIGTAYSFNGSSKKITTNAVSVTGPFTLSAWVKLGATGIDEKIMTNQDATGSAGGGYKLGVYSDNIPESESGNAGSRASLPNPVAFTSGAWHYVQGVYTGSTLSTYVDGAQYKILSTSNNPSANLNLYIGVGEGGSSWYFNGLIDEPRVSNVAKTADWIKAEYGDQNNPVSFTGVGVTATNTANAAPIPGALTYTWDAGAGNTDPTNAINWNNTTAGISNQAPAFDGTATLIIPAGLSFYPLLMANESLYGLTIASGATLNLNGFTLSVACNIYNNATTGGTGILTAGKTSSGITWNGSLAAQTFTGANTANTTALGNMIINNSSAGTLTITGGPVDVYNTITLTKGNLVINNAGNGNLTLKSSAALTASVAIIPSAYSIAGTVNVERFLTGGSTVSGGRFVYRNYRLMSSPVNAGLVGGNYPYTVNYIAASAIVSGASSSFGTLGGNPTIYVYSEDYTPSNASFTSGNFKGVTDISKLTSPYTLAVTSNGTGKALYVGNGFMFYFRGDKINSVGTSPGKTTYPYVAPESVVFTATGFLNQGSYTVNNWQTGSGLLYTTVAGNGAIMGFNLVGNPYPSSIDWEATNSGGIVATNINPSIYVFNPVTNQYNTYSAGTHVGNPVAFTGKIASGQGFFVKANNTSPSLVFNETAKSTTVINAGSGNLMMGAPASQAATQRLFRLRLSVDSLSYDDIAIGFKSTASAKYNFLEDSKYMAGLGAAEGLASYSTDSIPEPLSINFLPLPKQVPQIIKLNVTAKNSGRLIFERTQLDSLPKIYEIWLMDKYKKDSLDIRNNTGYAFDINTGDTASFGNNRFELIIRQDKALGIHLLNFTAVKASGGVQVTWKVENEENYTNFTVERSTDNGITFNALGGHASNSQSTYSFMDTNPVNTVDVYRLKVEDLNGDISYSNAITIVYNQGNQVAAAANINVYPNPASGLINLNINQPGSQSFNFNWIGNMIPAAPATDPAKTYSIKIINVSGTVVKSVISSLQTWQNDISALLPGTYVLQVLNNKDKSLVGRTTFVKM